MRPSTWRRYSSGSSPLSFAVYAARQTMPNERAFSMSRREPEVIGSA